MLKGEKVYLRTLEPSDAEVLFVWENDPEVWKVSHTIVPFSMHQLKMYVDSPQDIYVHQQIRFMICDVNTNKPIGAIDLFEFEPAHERVGVGILVYDQSDRGKGVATASLQLIIEYVFATLPVAQLFCNILEDNAPSLKLFQNAGFKITGKKEKWVKAGTHWKDEFLLQLHKM